MASFNLTADVWTQIIIGGSSLVDQYVQVNSGRALVALGTPSASTTAIDSGSFDDSVLYVPAGVSVYARPTGGVSSTAITTGNYGAGQSAAGFQLFDAATAVADPRRILATSKLRHVTNRVGVCSSRSGTLIRQGWANWMYSHVPISAIQLVAWNGYIDSTTGLETGAGGPMNASWAIHLPDGTIQRITWDGGAASKNIADNEIATTDLVQLPFTIPAFTPFRLKGFNIWSGGGGGIKMAWANVIDRGRGDEFQENASGGTDNSMNTTPFTGTGSNTQCYSPQLVLGYSNKPVILGAGDSIMAGVEDRFQDPNGGRGLVGRSVARFAPFINFGVPGDQAARVVVAGNYDKRKALAVMGGVTAAFTNHGINDLYSASRTDVQLLADHVAFNAFLGVRVMNLTLTPNTATTDAYATAANQTPKSGNATAAARRLAFNAAVRSGVLAGLPRPVDITAPVETDTTHERVPVQDGGVWLPQFMDTNGAGLHPITNALQAMVPVVDAALASYL